MYYMEFKAEGFSFLLLHFYHQADSNRKLFVYCVHQVDHKLEKSQMAFLEKEAERSKMMGAYFRIPKHKKIEFKDCSFSH